MGIGVQMISAVTGLPSQYEPLWWAAFFASSLLIYIESGAHFWRLTFWVAVLTVGTSLVFILGSVKDIDFPKVGRLG